MEDFQRLSRWWLILLCVTFILTPNIVQGVTSDDDALVRQAIKEMDRENYDEALAALTEAWQKGSHTPPKAFYLGKVYRLQLEYRKAREYLEEAVRLKPDYNEARLLLADTLMGLEQWQPAREQLKQLEAAGYQPGRTSLLLGRIAVRQGDYKKAEEYLRRAEQDPGVAQEAKFQLSLVLANQRHFKEARKTMEESIAVAPSSPTADIGKRYLTAFESRAKEYRPFHFTVTAGWDYDSNVTLQPGDAAAAQQVSGRGDAVYNQMGVMEYTFRAGRPWSLLTQYSFFQNFHRRLTKFDTVAHTAGVSPIFTWEKGRLYLPFNFNYTDVENDKYYTAYYFTPTYLHMVTPKVGLEFGGRVARQYYWFPVALPQDDRSGRILGASLGLYYFFKNQEGYLLARGIYEHNYASGNNWSNNSYRLYLAALYPVTSRLKTSFFLDLILQPYTNDFTSSPYLPHRSPRYDQIMILGAQATYAIYKGLEANIHYYFVRDSSNVSLYDYHRHIFGAQLGYRY
ncbi:MAG: tetratricopeptide repeat protein [Thermodesulfobacteriota bacterium]